jgi:AAA+ superfamily predicted ATPase
LVLKNTKKELIRALIAEHAAGGEPADVIEGKGNGIILLLHGGPGTGKTLTAESVAELTNRPLYRVTCGDIGTNVEDVEEYLASVFNLGKVWKCVVLLDEADVFLEERTQYDLARNALVSVFLRVLEYYDGILILTSNRIGTFDEAFKSRVQLIVHYPRLKKKRRRQVWENFFVNLKDIDPNARIQELRDKIDDLSHHPLNGREIRNAIRTAVLLARFRKQNLGYSHLKEVIGISNEFERYLQEVHGHDSSEWARARGDRAE